MKTKLLIQAITKYILGLLMVGLFTFALFGDCFVYKGAGIVEKTLKQ